MSSEANITVSSLDNLIYMVDSNFKDNQQRDRGTTFEYISLAYFRNEPKYSRYFDRVWLLRDVPAKYGLSKKDHGVDIVGRKRHTGELVAIQSKYYSQDRQINKSEIDSFLNEVGKKYYSEGIIVSSTDKWSSAAEKSLEDRSKNIIRIGFTELKNSKIDWSKFRIEKGEEYTKTETKKSPRPHQEKAIKAVLEGLEANDRGKLIMAPGTGKTYTSLRIAEELAIKKQEESSDAFVVLYLVPSIQLLSQSLTSWTSDTKFKMDTFAVTSDRKATRKTRNNDDDRDITVADIGFPATTNKDDLLKNQLYLKNSGDKAEIIAVFSTYHSIQVIGDAQRDGFYDFDLIIADEAHRTTGATKLGDDESHFVKVHNNSNVKAHKRLYQTATPRVYGQKAIEKAEERSVIIADMNDKETYGPELYRLGFGEAVHQGILSDYKVMILAVDEKAASQEIPDTLSDLETEIEFINVMKIIGVWNGLLRRKSKSNKVSGKPMKRAIAFTGTINQSKYITNIFDKVINEYLDSESYNTFSVDIDHADGTMNALEKNTKIDWLKSEVPDGKCRILSNARFLTEGVDVPDLDAVLFMQPRKSTIDIAQAVGRVMRSVPGKNYGYVILPITIHSDDDPVTALNSNEPYAVVWDVLNALRSIDEHFDAIVNQLELNKRKPEEIGVIEVGKAPVVDEKTGEYEISYDGRQTEIDLDGHDWRRLEDAIFAQIIDKVGSTRYWESWSEDVAKIAQRYIDRINSLLVDDANAEVKESFDRFLLGLRNNINASITVTETVEMLAQHLVTKPVFDALFEEESFALNNPISQAMSKMIAVLEEYGFSRQQDELKGFYDSVRMRAEGIDNLEAKQSIIVQLYEKFFKVGFPNTTDRLGIVFTPTPIVDFIVNSVEVALCKHFGTSMNNKNVNILDPFTGTGTFVTRLLQSEIISKENLLYKYTNEIYANEIVLLSYYIAAINIEETFKEISGEEYIPFPGIVLTDTFESTEYEPTIDDSIFLDNNERLHKQQETPITVIMSNPPYSAKQDNEDSNLQREEYPHLDASLRRKWIETSTATNKAGLLDSYIRAIRWSADRISGSGIIAFITNSSFLDGVAMDGMRKSLVEEFSTIYVVNLKGQIRRRNREQAVIEGGNVFDIMTGVAITILIKDTTAENKGELYYFNIGDALSKEEKLNKLNKLLSIKNINFEKIIPNNKGDWINQRNSNFDTLLKLGDKRAKDALFMDYTGGIKTGRDAWAINFSKIKLEESMKRSISYYNEHLGNTRFYEKDVQDISWTHTLKQRFERRERQEFRSDRTYIGMYRPFTKKHVYYDPPWVDRQYKMPKVMPIANSENLMISVSNKTEGKMFTSLMIDVLPDVNLFVGGSQNFPKYRYDSLGSYSGIRKDSLDKLDNLDESDVLYYLYGIFHSNEYKEEYFDDLSKSLPKIPNIKNKKVFIEVGKELANLHLNYENIAPYEHVKVEMNCENPSYKVRKMKFAKVEDSDGKKINDMSTIIFNKDITIKDIPQKAYAYEVNGRSAIGWIIDQYQIKTDRKSGITDDPNEYSEDPKYIFNLLLSVINVSVQTVDLANSLPPLEIIEE